MVVRYFLKQ